MKKSSLFSKMLALVLTLVMVVTSLPVTVLAKPGKPAEKFDIRIESEPKKVMEVVNQRVEKGQSYQYTAESQVVRGQETYNFVKFTEGGNVVTTDKTLVVENVQSAHSYVAVYEKDIRYTVTTSAVSGQITLVDETSEKYVKNAKCELVAEDEITVQDKTYEFVNWTENGQEVSKELKLEFEVSADRNLVAEYREVEYVTLSHKLRYTWQENGKFTAEDVEIEDTAEKVEKASDYSQYALKGLTNPVVRDAQTNAPYITYWAKELQFVYVVDGKERKDLEEKRIVEWSKLDVANYTKEQALKDMELEVVNNRVSLEDSTYEVKNVTVEGRNYYADVTNGRINTLAYVTVELEEVKDLVTVNHYLFYNNKIGNVLITSEEVERIDTEDLTEYALEGYTLHDQDGDKKATENDNVINIYYWSQSLTISATIEGDATAFKETPEYLISYDKYGKFTTNLEQYKDELESKGYTKTLKKNNKEYELSDKSSVEFVQASESAINEGEFNSVVINLVYTEVVKEKDLVVNHYLAGVNSAFKTTNGYVKDINCDEEDDAAKYASFIDEEYEFASATFRPGTKETKVFAWGCYGLGWYTQPATKAELNIYYQTKDVKVNYVFNGSVIKEDVVKVNAKATLDDKEATYSEMYSTRINVYGTNYDFVNLEIVLPEENENSNYAATLIVNVAKNYGCHTHDLKYTDNEDGTHTVTCRGCVGVFPFLIRCDYRLVKDHKFNEDGKCICGAKAEVEVFELNLGRYQFPVYNEAAFIEKAELELEERIEELTKGDSDAFFPVDGAKWVFDDEYSKNNQDQYLMTLLVDAADGNRYNVKAYILVAGSRKHKSPKKTSNGNQTEKISDQGVAAGVDKDITRAEFTNLVAELFTLVDNGKGKEFEDISNNSYRNVIDVMTKYGLTVGYNDTQFGPDDLITNEQVYIILVRGLIATKQLTLMTAEEIEAQLANVTDKDTISEWSRDYVAMALKAGILVVDAEGKVRPVDFTTYNTATELLKKYAEMLKIEE